MNAIIEDTFFLYKNRCFTYNVKLNFSFLSYTPNSDKVKENVTVSELVKDIIGCSLMKSNSKEAKHKVFITIYSYPLVGKSENKKKRKRKTITFEVSYKNSFEENLEVANRWRMLLYHALYCSEGNEKTSVPLFKFKKKILIFINPKSGPGTAFEIYEKRVKPVLAEAEVGYDSIVTDHANHAYELIQHRDIQSYAGIIIVAGDGLIYEIYNGLLQRSDSNVALSVPIGVIPGGSGNGLASSISHSINEPYLSNPVLVSTLNIVNPVVTPLDLVLLQTHKGHKMISFLSIGFGILSDIDIESERLRALGEARFTVYGLTRVFYLRKYKTRLSYKVAHDVMAKVPHTNKRPHFLRSQTMLEEVSVNGERGPKCKLPPRPQSMTFDKNDEVVTAIELASDASLEEISKVKDDDKVDAITPKQIQSTWDSPCKIYTGWESSFEDPVPDDWETVEDDFVSIYAVNQPYIGSESFFSPKSTLNDGVLWLCYMKGNVSKKSVMKFLVMIESGTHIDLPGVTYVPVTDLRIVPLCPSGKITVDGEMIDFEPIQASVLPGKGRVMIRRS